jgi:hypothetical protein
MTPLPHLDGQSASVLALQPAAQHPSVAVPLQAVIEVCEHVGSQLVMLPPCVSTVHESPSSQLKVLHSGVAGEASQVSFPSRTPLPHTGAQSLSFVALHAPRPPPGQHPSPLTQAVTGLCAQVMLHVAAAPFCVSVVQLSLSLHPMSLQSGMAGPTFSQVSAPSRTPFPQTAPQSLSLLALHPPGQQPSALAHAVTLLCVHVTLQVASAPLRTSVVHALLSLHVIDAHVVVAGATSHVSPASRRPFPHPGQSTSLVGPQPAGQKPSAGPQARAVVVQT